MSRVQVQTPDPQGYWLKQIKCQEACPVHTDARGYVRAIAEGRLEDAYLIARGPNPLASICGRVCGAPCEAACRRGDLDQAVSIRALKRFAIEQHVARNGAGGARTSPFELLKRLIDHARGRQSSRSEELAGFVNLLSEQQATANRDGEKVAIIGSGPAGLAAAHDLALLGFRPTVYEMEPVPAGMLAVGIPQYRLPRELIQAEVEFIRSLGVEFICNTQVGKDISLAEIRRQHRATIIAVGLKRSRALPIPGAETPGVYGGVEFLRDVALGKPADVHGAVVVIGGGNVAYDIARTVVRQTGVDISRLALRSEGVQSVRLVSLESLEEMPADDAEILEGDEEGVFRENGWGPVEIVAGDDGRVSGVVFQRCLRVFDENRRFAPHFDTANRRTIPADTVLWGIGQRPDLSFIDADDIERDERGLVKVDPITFRTTADDVYLAGDIAYGPKLLIHAVACGKQVARHVFEAVRGQKLTPHTEVTHVEIANYRREADYEKLPRTAIPALPPQQRRGSQSTVVEVGYDSRQAMCEGCRCLDCGVNTIFDSDKCILCGGCADVCPELCLELVSLDRLDSDEAVRQAIRERIGDDDLSQHSAIIKDETKCIRCALCAERCPVGAITMERFNVQTVWRIEPSLSSVAPAPAAGGVLR
jgi:NADPH-dependent glutamate synthase beta subunit-like oxidoreductase